MHPAFQARTWEQRKLGEVFEYEQPQPYIVQNAEYDDSYPVPVLTAGKSFILGYTNESFGVKLATPKQPIIIFDDFTTSSRYVDFPFKVKSSAAKLLKLNNRDDDITVAFNVLQTIGYQPAGHERHWISKFAHFRVLMPSSTVEQRLIGTFFRNVDDLITLHQREHASLISDSNKPLNTAPQSLKAGMLLALALVSATGFIREGRSKNCSTKYITPIRFVITTGSG